MLFTEIKTKNFQGLPGEKTFSLNDRFLVLAAENGSGKTSFINAFRYLLTGAEPDGQMFYNGMEECSVTGTDTEGVVYTRGKNAKGSFYLIGGKPTTGKAFTEHLLKATGVPAKTIKTITSSEILSSLDAARFGELLLSFVSVIKKEDIMLYAEGLSDKAKKILESNLEDNVSTQTLEKLYKSGYEQRREMKKKLLEENSKIVYEAKRLHAPTKKKEELVEEYTRLAEAQKEFIAYKANKEAFDKLQATIAANKAEIEKLQTKKAELEKDGIPQETTEDARKALTTENAKANADLVRLAQEEAVLKKSEDSMQKVKEALSTSACPIAKSIVCTTDKTGAAAEIDENIGTLQKSIKKTRDLLAQAKATIAKTEEELAVWNQNKERYQAWKALTEQIKAISESMPKEIENPVKPEGDDQTAKVEELKAEIQNFDDYVEYIDLRKSYLKEKETYDAINSLVEALSPKGTIKQKIILGFIKRFEAACNAKAAGLRPGMELRFRVNHGISIEADMKGSGAFLPFPTLSGGEKATVLFVMMDLFSQLSGLRTILMDELSVLDSAGFAMLIDLLYSHQEDYDHIVLCTVDHKDLLDTINQYNIAPYNWV